MSSPVTAADSCSRLSAHLAYGTISIRQVYQVLEDRQALLRRSRKAGKSTGAWLTSLASFSKRLHWHCHFIQKLEDEPALEFRNLARAYDGLRENDFSDERFIAWQQGQTGYPLIDACMRCLAETGWINFRMRALLVSFASYHLWLHWRPTALFLAKQFVDYEPGIHFSQFQMQSGTTGINAIRIYSPVKQVQDQDPGGTFIRRWVPELSQVPDIYLAQPELMPAHEQKAAHCELGVDYPLPIVEQVSALKSARDKIFSVRSTGSARKEAQTVYKKHGSRKRPAARRKPATKQGLLPF